MSAENQMSNTRRSLWVAMGFYILIACEFFYMATPFAAFFYSTYGPVLTFLNSHPSLAWLNATFLPHVVRDTSSVLLNAREPVGIALIVIGSLGFCVGAAQVYYYKLMRKQAVLSGLYKFVRHPQYAFLMVWGLGLVLMWPRTLVLLSFVTMIFVYFRLARAEEMECERKFGTAYSLYRASTPMFFPVRHGAVSSPRRWPVVLSYYCAALVAATGMAGILRSWSVDSLYVLYEKNAAHISVTAMDQDSLRRIVGCAMGNARARQLLNDGDAADAEFINYVVPAGMFMLEIPMHEGADSRIPHFFQSANSSGVSKIIFTKAETRDFRKVEGQELLFRTVRRIPVLEVTVDPKEARVLTITEPPSRVPLEDLAMPLY